MFFYVCSGPYLRRGLLVQPPKCWEKRTVKNYALRRASVFTFCDVTHFVTVDLADGAWPEAFEMPGKATWGL